MKTAFVITSSIEVNNQFPLTYSNVRSFFSNEERLRQTIFTINNIDTLYDHNVDIYLLDSSENYKSYKDFFQYQNNLKYISILELYPDIYFEIISHKNKSYCETLSLIRFLNDFKSELSNYDNIFKISGRYFTDHSFKNLITLNLADNLIFKFPLKWEWKDEWNYNMVDRRIHQNNNCLHQYCSVLYGFGKNTFSTILNIYNDILEIVKTEEGKIYDVETLIYFFSRPYKTNIIHQNFYIYGWLGPNGQFVKY